MMSQFALPLYEPQPSDVFFLPQSSNEAGVPANPVNLNAITYYANLGMKPKRIATLVGTTHTTIWANNKLRQAYEDGGAYHELWLRSVCMEAAVGKPNLAFDMLGRSNGPMEVDVADGHDPTEVVVAAPTKIELIIVKNEGPERDSIQAELNRVLALADQKAKKE